MHIHDVMVLPEYQNKKIGTLIMNKLIDKVKELLLTKASEDFDWSDISPTIFGAVFESTLNPETRRSGGMHYTSIENIHKVIDPLFLNDLKILIGIKERIKKIIFRMLYLKRWKKWVKKR